MSQSSLPQRTSDVDQIFASALQSPEQLTALLGADLSYAQMMQQAALELAWPVPAIAKEGDAVVARQAERQQMLMLAWAARYANALAREQREAEQTDLIGWRIDEKVREGAVTVDEKGKPKKSLTETQIKALVHDNEVYQEQHARYVEAQQCRAFAERVYEAVRQRGAYIEAMVRIG